MQMVTIKYSQLFRLIKLNAEQLSQSNWINWIESGIGWYGGWLLEDFQKRSAFDRTEGNGRRVRSRCTVQSVFWLRPGRWHCRRLP